jgi:hypothetical protein
MDLKLPGPDYRTLAKEVDVLASFYDVSPLADAPDGGAYGGLYGRLGEVEALTERAVSEAIEFALATEGRLRHLIHLGSITVAGGHRGIWTEEDLSSGQRHRTRAERARYRAERLLWRERRRIPFTVARVGPVLGDARTGESGWYHGPHDLLEALLTLWTGEGAAAARAAESLRLHPVTADRLARTVRRLGAQPPPRSAALHLVPGETASPEELLTAVRRAAGSFRPSEAFERRLRARWGTGAAAVARTLALLDSPAAFADRRALDLERAEGGDPGPRLGEALPALALAAVARSVEESERLAQARIEDALDA